MIRWLVALILLASGGAASARDLAVLKIRIDGYEDTYWPVLDCKPDEECIPFSGWVKYRVTLLRTYAGTVPHRTFSAVMLMHPRYVDRLELYVVAEPAVGSDRLHQDGQDLLPGKEYVWIHDRSQVGRGFCLSLDDDDAKNSGLAAAFEALRRDHPCKEN